MPNFLYSEGNALRHPSSAHELLFYHFGDLFIRQDGSDVLRVLITLLFKWLLALAHVDGGKYLHSMLETNGRGVFVFHQYVSSAIDCATVNLACPLCC